MTILAHNDDVINALSFVHREAREDAIRLFSVVLDSGADPLTALTAVYRWTAGRPAYIEIHAGLERFFQGEVCI